MHDLGSNQLEDWNCHLLKKERQQESRVGMDHLRCLFVTQVS